VKQGENAKYELDKKEAEVEGLKKRQDTLLSDQAARFRQLINSQQAMEADLRRQKSVLLMDVTGLQRKVREQKQRTISTGIICTTATALFFLIFKR